MKAPNEAAATPGRATAAENIDAASDDGAEDTTSATRQELRAAKGAVQRLARNAVPPFLHDLPRFVRWSLQQARLKDGTLVFEDDGTPKLVKFPRPAADAAQFLTFDEVADEPITATGGVGLSFNGGIANANGFRLVALDVDVCRDPASGELAAWVLPLLDRVRGAYIEVTPSGLGLRVWLRVRNADPTLGKRLPPEGTEQPPGVTKRMEVDPFGHTNSARFVTVTGERLPSSGDGPLVVEDLDWLAALYRPASSSAADPGGPLPEPVGPRVDDETILAAVLARSDGQKLLDGDWRGLGVRSCSEAFYSFLHRVVAAANGHKQDALRFVMTRGVYALGRADSNDPGKYEKRDWVEPQLDRALRTSRELQRRAGITPFKPLDGVAPAAEATAAPWAATAVLLPPPAAGLLEPGCVDPVTKRLVLDPQRTLPTAEAFIRQFFVRPEGRTLHCHAGQLRQWVGNRFEPIEDEQLRSQLQPWLHRAVRTTSKSVAPFPANPGSVSAALTTIRDHVHLPASLSVPCWIAPRPDDPSVNELLVGRTKVLHIPTRRVLPATPRLFCTAALDFDHDPDAPAPAQWTAFVNELFGADAEAIALLQEWFGYCLTGDTSQQKMLLVIGPRRSGKGTIGRVLRALVGAANVVGPTTNSLASNFGLQPLLGKSLAIVSDARFAGDGVPTLVERLLCISGEDALTIDRKFMESVSMKLPTRFVFLSNELPMFRDSSAALAGRFLLLTLTKSFYDNEDPGLSDKLRAELPGILLWAIEGWHRLRARGRFQEPASSRAAVEQLADLASPVAAFLREQCVVASGQRVAVATLYSAYRHWCFGAGIKDPPTAQRFGRDLVAAQPGVRVRQGTEGRFYEGLGLQGGGA